MIQKDLVYKTRKGKFGKEIYVQDPHDKGYTAYFAEFPNIVSQGNTIKEAQTNLWNTTHDVLKYLIKRSDFSNSLLTNK